MGEKAVNDLGGYLFCFRCGAELRHVPRGRRQARVHVTGRPGLFGGISVEHEHYELVTMCMPCWEAEEEAERRWQQWKWRALGGSGLGLFGWLYLGPAGLIGAVVVILASIFYHRRQQPTYLPREEKQ